MPYLNKALKLLNMFIESTHILLEFCSIFCHISDAVETRNSSLSKKPSLERKSTYLFGMFAIYQFCFQKCLQTNYYIAKVYFQFYYFFKKIDLSRHKYKEYFKDITYLIRYYHC